MGKNAVGMICTNYHCKEEVVGHVQQNFYMSAFAFLSLTCCVLNTFAAGERLSHLGEYGIEITANCPFYGPERAVELGKKPNSKDQRKL